MPRKRLLWQLYRYYLLIIVVSLFAAVLYTSRSIKQFYLMQVKGDLEARAHLVERHVMREFTPEKANELDAVCKELAVLSLMRITLVLEDGTVIGDSAEDPSRMENHANRPEIARALTGLPGESVRYSETIKQKFMYVALPARWNGGIVGAVRTSLPITFIDDNLRSIYIRIFAGGLVVAVLAAGISSIVVRRIRRPLEEIRRGVSRFAENDLGYRLPVHDLEGVSDLAEVMNEMAAKLEDRIQTETRQRNEQDAVFSGMVEGLIAVDVDERIFKMNRAASAIIGVEAEEADGKTIQEVVRNPDLQKFVSRALNADKPVEGEIILHRPEGESFLQAHGAQLVAEDGGKRGVVIVINDVTRLRRLENVRKEFVANVSHELKTPITSIKGFVETLRDGAVNHPIDSGRFLDIIATQIERMNSIVEDLLLLSQFEQENGVADSRLEEHPLKSVIDEALMICGWKADEKNVTVDVTCSEDITALINPALLEQALVNLIDNAIKYSDPGGVVDVRAVEEGAEVVVGVRDEGCGIDPEHGERLFERFYRVDRARSRKLGGTGLGLAIVKHIMIAHKGSVSFESTPGAGSTFYIRLRAEA